MLSPGGGLTHLPEPLGCSGRARRGQAGHPHPRCEAALHLAESSTAAAGPGEAGGTAQSIPGERGHHPARRGTEHPRSAGREESFSRAQPVTREQPGLESGRQVLPRRRPSLLRGARWHGKVFIQKLSPLETSKESTRPGLKWPFSS